MSEVLLWRHDGFESFEKRFSARAKGDVLVLTFPSDLSAADVESIANTVGPRGQRVRRGFVWDLRNFEDALKRLRQPEFTVAAETLALGYLFRCWDAVVRCGGHVVFINGAEFAGHYNEHVWFGGYFYNYATEEAGVAAVQEYLDELPDVQ